MCYHVHEPDHDGCHGKKYWELNRVEIMNQTKVSLGDGGGGRVDGGGGSGDGGGHGGDGGGGRGDGGGLGGGDGGGLGGGDDFLDGDGA